MTETQRKYIEDVVLHCTLSQLWEEECIYEGYRGLRICADRSLCEVLKECDEEEVVLQIIKTTQGLTGQKDWYYNCYLQSEYWHNLRKKTIEDYGGRCALCGKDHNLQVHHVSYNNLLLGDRENLICLCENCHKRLHGFLDDLEAKRQELASWYNQVALQTTIAESGEVWWNYTNALRHEEVEACARYIGMLRTKHVARISTCFNIEDRDVDKNLMVCASNRGVFIDQKPDNMLKQIKETRIKHGWR